MATPSSRRRRAANSSASVDDAIEPLRIVDEHEHRPLLGGDGEQAENRRADRKPIARRRIAAGERALQRARLRLGQAVQMVQLAGAQLRQPGKREIDLRLDPARREHPHAIRLLDRPGAQRGLADPGLPEQHQHAATPTARGGQHRCPIRPHSPLTAHQHLPGRGR